MKMLGSSTAKEGFTFGEGSFIRLIVEQERTALYLLNERINSISKAYRKVKQCNWKALETSGGSGISAFFCRNIVDDAALSLFAR